MGSGTCQRCGDEYEFGHDGDDPFTTITVSFHDDDRGDFAESVCQSCGDELLDEVYTALPEVTPADE
jgi:uncharacterized protein (DUF983 family)